MAEKRVENRKDFSYYMRLTDATTKKLIGHLSDISTGGFKLDSDEVIPVEQDFRFHLALTPDVAEKPFMIFSARSKWCQSDPIDPFVFNIGFHILQMHSEDRDVFNRVLQLYGKAKPKKGSDTAPLSPRTNKW
ncbi:MAG: PilZ domain-containing protein [Anaerolineae bacterium]|jgi:hypothetical protein|nr:PilZ domain-containing protein [Anaerolineae bacterium]MBT4310778.1 PilZ domain-containing protein [Anaerolineae bacterium]MBT4458224.1 PilZ domain-containing protein [Anaerolineae bacterium]MBT4841021.1 PilZ domain-containing protein [Anaerolineae bacterium]MBT6061105.1 PilZ domain-containing protein [Anaerolineae bacterium]